MDAQDYYRFPLKSQSHATPKGFVDLFWDQDAGTFAAQMFGGQSAAPFGSTGSSMEAGSTPVRAVAGYQFMVNGTPYYEYGFIPFSDNGAYMAYYVRGDYTTTQIEESSGFYSMSYNGTAWVISSWSEFTPTDIVVSDPVSIGDAPTPDLAVWSGLTGPAGTVEAVTDAIAGEAGTLGERRFANGVVWEYTDNWNPPSGYLHEQSIAHDDATQLVLTVPDYLDALFVVQPIDSGATEMSNIVILLPMVKNIRPNQAFAIISSRDVASFQIINPDGASFVALGGPWTTLGAMEMAVFKCVDGVNKLPTLIRIA